MEISEETAAAQELFCALGDAAGEEVWGAEGEEGEEVGGEE